jgi:hypothetical protein
VNVPALALPPGVVTVIFTVPDPEGLVTVICVPESAVTFAAAPPKLTPVAPLRLVPVSVTAVPPPVVPLDGDTLVTAGCFACEPEPEPEPEIPDEPEDEVPEDEVPEDEVPEDEVPEEVPEDEVPEEVPEDEVPDVDPPDEPEEDEPAECA